MSAQTVSQSFVKADTTRWKSEEVLQTVSKYKESLTVEIGEE
jgi:hypothetical protein